MNMILSGGKKRSTSTLASKESEEEEGFRWNDGEVLIKISKWVNARPGKEEYILT